METVEETRRVRLRMLVDELDGLANLVEKLGLSRKETSGLSRILNGNLRHERGGEPYVMGSPMARDLETKLNKPRGWMDTPPNYTDLPHNPQIAHVIQAMERMDEWQQERAVAIVTTLSLPPPGQTPEAPAPALNSSPPTLPTDDQVKRKIDQLREDSKKKKAPRRNNKGDKPIKREGDSDA